MLKSIQIRARCRLKQKYFNDVPTNVVPTESHVTNLSDAQWKDLVNGEKSTPCALSSFSRASLVRLAGDVGFTKGSFGSSGRATRGRTA
jgi:hypothetical protein